MSEDETLVASFPCCFNMPAIVGADPQLAEVWRRHPFYFTLAADGSLMVRPLAELAPEGTQH